MSDWTLYSLADAIRTRRISPTEAVRECLQNIERSKLNAFVAVNAERALDAAKRLGRTRPRAGSRAAARRAARLQRSVLYRRHARVVRNLRPDYFVAERTATAVDRLEQAGAITIGKLNMTELAMSPFGDNARFGDCRNPWSFKHCAGGSSSGSAAAIAGGLVTAALGSDTGGSIRQPAAYCRRRGPKADVRPRSARLGPCRCRGRWTTSGL